VYKRGGSARVPGTTPTRRLPAHDKVQVNILCIVIDCIRFVRSVWLGVKSSLSI
jgi:hypothetical protein